jgi:HSP20 family molecular chaperone IbpA
MATTARREPPATIFDWFDDAFPALFGWPTLTPAASPGKVIRIEDFTEGNDYVIRAELPGLDPDKDVELKVTDGMLTIRAERKQEQCEGRRSEFRYGVLLRSIALPTGAEENRIQAEYANGVLTVRVPVAEENRSARTIPIQRVNAEPAAEATSARD